MVRTTVAAVDLGTTCSAVVTLTVEAGQDPLLNPKGRFHKINKYAREPARSGREPSREETPSQIWYGPNGEIEIGYQVTERKAESLRDGINEGIYLEDWKLLLDDGPNTNHIRRRLKCKLDILGKSIIEVIADYLERLLDHAKNQQQVTGKGFYEGDNVQLVVTIPAIWNAPAFRDMEEAVAIAARKLHYRMDDKPFFVYEPDAAARYVSTVMYEHHMAIGETFMVCDAGGGTVDLRTVTVVNEYPPKHEPTVIGGGAACGSVFLNKRFTAEFTTLLNKDPLQGQRCGRSTEATGDLATLDFDINAKRRFCHSDERALTVSCPGLVQSGFPGFKLGCYMAESGFLFAHIFMPVISQILHLIEQQLELALTAGHVVSKIFLMGGFADSRCLQKFLKQHLEIKGCELVVPGYDNFDSDTAIAQGALLMYLERNHGPGTILKTSYAFMQNEGYEPDLHGDVETRLDSNDGKEYVDGCLHFYFRAPPKNLLLTPKNLEKDQVIDLTIFSNHSRAPMLDHLHHNDPRNHGCRELGRIEFILTKEQLQALEPKPERREKERAKPRKKGQKKEYYYAIEYEPVFTVRGANMWYELFVRGKSMAMGHIMVKPTLEATIWGDLLDHDENENYDQAGLLEEDMTGLSLSRI